MKILKNKIFIGIVCIILALVLALIIVPKNTGEEKKVNVVQVNQNVAQGTCISDDMIKTVSIPESMVTNETVRTKEEVVGMYTTGSIYVGDNITTSKITKVPTNADLYTLKDGELAMSIAIPDLASSVSAKIMKGDIVAVYGYKTSNVGSGNVGDIIEKSNLMNLEVLAVTNSSGVDVDAAQMSGQDNSDTVPATLTFKVDKEQLANLISLQKECSITTALVKRGNNNAENTN